MDHHLSVAGALTIRTAQDLVDPIVAVDGWLVDSSPVVLDLSAVSFATPGGIVTLAAVIESASTVLPRLHVIAPVNPDCRRYLAAAGFVQTVGKVVDVAGADDLRGIEPSSGLQTVLPLTRLAASEEIPGLLRDLEQRIDDMLGGGDASWERAKRPILSTIREICDNVFQHAGGVPGWIAAQRYRNGKTNRPYVEIAIGDAGRGVRRSLATRFTELLKATDSEALDRMLQEHLSRHTAPYRGTGYYVLQCATKELDGSFYLRSGGGAIERRRRGAVQRLDGLAPWPGTHLQLSLTCS